MTEVKVDGVEVNLGVCRVLMLLGEGSVLLVKVLQLSSVLLFKLIFQSPDLLSDRLLVSLAARVSVEASAALLKFADGFAELSGLQLVLAED